MSAYERVKTEVTEFKIFNFKLTLQQSNNSLIYLMHVSCSRKTSLRYSLATKSMTVIFYQLQVRAFDLRFYLLKDKRRPVTVTMIHSLCCSTHAFMICKSDILLHIHLHPYGSTRRKILVYQIKTGRPGSLVNHCAQELTTGAY